jgi:PAS domain-containing protein
MDESGQPRRMFGALQDITERKRVEEELRLRGEELDRVMAAVPDYLWSGATNSEGRWTYRYYSPVVLKVLGRLLSGVQSQAFLCSLDRSDHRRGAGYAGSGVAARAAPYERPDALDSPACLRDQRARTRAGFFKTSSTQTPSGQLITAISTTSPQPSLFAMPLPSRRRIDFRTKLLECLALTGAV